MAFTTIAGAKRPAGLARIFDTLSEALHEHRAYTAAYRQTHRELSALSDRDLADLGMARTDIGRVAHDAALDVLRQG